MAKVSILYQYIIKCNFLAFMPADSL